jgi:hypothetical protein
MTHASSVSLPKKVEKWLDSDFFPQRVLLSGGDKTLEKALCIGARLQKKTPEQIRRGYCLDTLLLADDGNFKIGESESAEQNSARGIAQWIVKKPIAPHRLIILEHFERLTLAAMNALLKVLEEPPEKAIFLLTTRNHHQLMETILSRVTVVRIPQDFEDFVLEEDIKNFFDTPHPIWRFKKIDQLDKDYKQKKDRTVFSDFVRTLIQHARFFPHYQRFLPELWEAEQCLKSNINARLTLERLALILSQGNNEK